MVRMGRKAPDRQGTMVSYQVTRRLEINAMDVLEISPTGKDGFAKVQMMGDALTRWMLELPMRDESARTIVRQTWTIG